MDNILVGAAGSGESAGNAFVPDIQVVAGIADDDLLSRGATGSMQTDNILHGHGEKTVGIGIAKILLIAEGQLVQVVDGPDIVRRDAGLLHLAAVEGNVFIYAAHRRGKALILQGDDLLTRRSLDFGRIISFHLFLCVSAQRERPFVHFFEFCRNAGINGLHPLSLSEIEIFGQPAHQNKIDGLG